MPISNQQFQKHIDKMIEEHGPKVDLCELYGKLHARKMKCSVIFNAMDKFINKKNKELLDHTDHGQPFCYWPQRLDQRSQDLIMVIEQIIENGRIKKEVRAQEEKSYIERLTAEVEEQSPPPPPAPKPITYADLPF